MHDDLLEPQWLDVLIAVETEVGTVQGEQLSRCFVRASWETWGSADHFRALLKLSFAGSICKFSLRAMNSGAKPCLKP